jgi:GT2 family glycosyltransferase
VVADVERCGLVQLGGPPGQRALPEHVVPVHVAAAALAGEQPLGQVEVLDGEVPRELRVACERGVDRRGEPVPGDHVHLVGPGRRPREGPAGRGLRLVAGAAGVRADEDARVNLLHGSRLSGGSGGGPRYGNCRIYRRGAWEGVIVVGEVGAERLVVAVLTYRRPERIAALVPVLVEQAADLARRGEGTLVSVLVVDNDAAGTGAAAVAEAAAEADTAAANRAGEGAAWPVTTVVEPEPGISAARNRALHASADQDLLVFVDDDEVPHAGWLHSLWATYRESGAAAVAGPVTSRYAVEPDPWVVAGGFYDRAHRSRLRTGTVVASAATNNLLLDLRVVRRAGLAFDPDLGLSGGEDTLFTSALTAAGGRIVWCAEAVVSDVVPADRLTRAYLITRTAGLANASARVALLLAPDPGRRAVVRARVLAAGLARGALGALGVAVAALRGDVARDAHGRRSLARSRGELLAAFGKVLLPYAR